MNRKRILVAVGIVTAFVAAYLILQLFVDHKLLSEVELNIGEEVLFEEAGVMAIMTSSRPNQRGRNLPGCTVQRTQQRWLIGQRGLVGSKRLLIAELYPGGFASDPGSTAAVTGWGIFNVVGEPQGVAEGVQFAVEQLFGASYSGIDGILIETEKAAEYLKWVRIRGGN